MTYFRHSLTPTTDRDAALVAEAIRLFDAGLNVFPIVPGSKIPYGEHGFLTTTRLYRPWFNDLMAGSNIAVMTGRLSGNLVVLDCDTPTEYERVGKALEAHGLTPWIRNSIRGGQFWLRCADGEVANSNRGTVQILGNHVYSVAPPSVHPDGMVYDWLAREGEEPPVVPLAELQAALPFMPLGLVRRMRPPAFPEKTDALPPVADRVLVGHDISGYKSHSEAEYAACLSLMGLGFSNSEILRVFRRESPPHYHKDGRR